MKQLPEKLHFDDIKLDEILSKDLTERIADEVTEYLTERYGFCINAFSWTIDVDIDGIDWDTEE